MIGPIADPDTRRVVDGVRDRAGHPGDAEPADALRAEPPWTDVVAGAACVQVMMRRFHR